MTPHPALARLQAALTATATEPADAVAVRLPDPAGTTLTYGDLRSLVELAASSPQAKFDVLAFALTEIRRTFTTMRTGGPGTTECEQLMAGTAQRALQQVEAVQ